ncbi:MAG TPA: hypothetical protein DER07_09870 [Armatimonadetes bacterium]|nr:hypothetical protein [Armatimonadota bacterium]
MGLLKSLRRVSLWRGYVSDLVRDERKYPGKVRLGERLRAWSRGLLSESYLSYGAGETDLRLYLNDVERYVRTPFVNGPGTRLVNDKLLFHEVVAPHARTPEILGWVLQGRWHAVGSSPNSHPLRVLLGAPDGSRFVLRLRTGGGGRGVAFLEAPDGALLLDGRAYGPSELDGLWAGFQDHILTRFVEQGSYARAIFPAATNTLRVLSMRDPESGRVFLAAAIHRFGTSASAPLDNVGRGGLWCEVDLSTGTLGRAVTRVVEGRPQFRTDHPETGAAITGVALPCWPQTLETLLRLHEALPLIQQVGWDLVLADDGPWIIEGNNYSGIDIFQVFGPLLTDPRVERFYRHHRVLRRRVPGADATAHSG